MTFSRFYPIDARLFTWEWTSSFDVAPNMKELRASFEKEFPKLRMRLEQVGGFFRLLHLVSFNSTEGRRSRYLVVVAEHPLPNARKRLLPRQVAVLSAADRFLRRLGPAGDNSGNFLCHGIVGGRFYALIFFEGRLCHWSELCAESFSQERIESELVRFRRFLKKDPLFSRDDSFEEVCIDGLIPCDMKRGSRDPFWKRIDLRREHMVPKRKRSHVLAVVSLLFAVACWKLLLSNLVEPGTARVAFDVSAVELETPPAWQESVEDTFAAKPIPQNIAVELRRCVLPNFQLKGVIAARLMMAEVEGVPLTVLLGDSLGNFKLLSVRRDGVDLVCGDSLVRREVVHATF